MKNISLILILIISGLLISILAIFDIRRQINFDKPSLLKVFYDGDFNGTSIDFKTDGTYIFDNAAIGLSNYFYGTYKITDNSIIMDKDLLDNLDHFKYLEIREKENEDLYLYQIDSLGNLIETSTQFRVVMDNRIDKKKK